MSQLDDILEGLRAYPITGLDPPAKQAIKDLFMSIVGEDEISKGFPDPVDYTQNKNYFRKELRQKIEEL